jgi:hypothetical protein
MRIASILVSLLLCCVVLEAQQTTDYAVRLIKIGNTYREALQYGESERTLKTGLSMAAQKGNTYWEAVAAENLGFLYRDEGDTIQATSYFTRAQGIYQRMGLDGSKMAMEQLLKSMKRGSAPDLYAGIDIGSTGVKMSLVSVSLGSEGRYIYNITKDTSINSRFADISATSFAATRDAVRSLVQLIARLNIPGDHVYILFSSGSYLALSRVPAYNADSIARDYTGMVRGVIPAYTDTVRFLTPQKEGMYTATGLVFPRVKNKSLILDIGGGNTKGGYYDNGEFKPLSLPYGSRTLDATANTLPENVGKELYSLLNQAPMVQTKSEVFLLGGIVWAMMNYMYPEKSFTDYSEFTYEDVAHFKTLATGDYNNLQSYVQSRLDAITDPAKQTKASATVENVRHVFTPENLRKGAILLEAIAASLRTPTVSKHFYFINNGAEVAYITGYIVDNIARRYKATNEAR